jgi:hypothetical protein
MNKKLITMPIALLLGICAFNNSAQANQWANILAEAEQTTEIDQNTVLDTSQNAEPPNTIPSDLAPIDDSPDSADPSEFPTSPEPLEFPASSEPSMSEPSLSDTSADSDYALVDLDSLPASVDLVGADPEAIAVALFGNTEPVEGNFQEEIVSQLDGEQAVVTITQLGLADDSVQGVRFRMKFDQLDAQTWELVWVGVQQTCYQGRGSQEWTKDVCV